MKKIVWLTNSPPGAGKRRMGLKEFGSGTWLENLSSQLAGHKDYSIYIISPFPGNELSFEENNINYYIVNGSLSIFSSGEKKLLHRISEIIETISPDLIHIHGTEKIFGLLQLKNTIKVPVIISLQGLTGPLFKCYSSHFFSSFKPILASNLSLNDKIRSGIMQAYAIMALFLSGRREKKIIRSNKAFFGRTAFDKDHIKKINPAALYFTEPRLLRPGFYSAEWDLKNADRFSIILLNIRGPFKNAAIAVKAVSNLKSRYAGIQLRIGGIDIKGHYAQYLLLLAKRLGVASNIKLLGYLKEDETVDWLKRSHVFCLTSLMENSPNTLAEAQMIGMPCIAHLKGGVQSYIEDQCSLTYENNNLEVLTENIDRVFSDDNLALSLGKKARKVAGKRHDIDHAVHCVEDAYNLLIEKKPEHEPAN